MRWRRHSSRERVWVRAREHLKFCTWRRWSNAFGIKNDTTALIYDCYYECTLSHHTHTTQHNTHAQSADNESQWSHSKHRHRHCRQIPTTTTDDKTRRHFKQTSILTFHHKFMFESKKSQTKIHTKENVPLHALKTSPKMYSYRASPSSECLVSA